MKMKIIGSTKIDHFLPIDEALNFGGKSAGICYMPIDFDAILDEDNEKTIKRVQRTLKSGHHSVYDHPTYNVLLEDIPKILAMVLNNEGFYTTSEKSARYTKMNPSKEETALYYKWMSIFKTKIQEVYPQIKNTQAEKLAQENARYMISVFTNTTLEYTVSLRQFSCIISMMKKFIEESSSTAFNEKLKECMLKFIKECKEFDIPYLNSDMKNKKLSLFDNRKSRLTEFGENYSVNYLGSFAQLAQAHRHRTLDYKMRIPSGDKVKFYIPPIIRAENNDGNIKLENDWISDINSVAHIFPQGMLIEINERGTYENFILKAKERLCGSAQLEIAQQTEKTLIEYIKHLKCHNTEIKDDGEVNENYEIKEQLEQFVIKKHDGGYTIVPRCKILGWTCNSHCIWGAKALERLI